MTDIEDGLLSPVVYVNEAEFAANREQCLAAAHAQFASLQIDAIQRVMYMLAEEQGLVYWRYNAAVRRLTEMQAQIRCVRSDGVDCEIVTLTKNNP